MYNYYDEVRKAMQPVLEEVIPPIVASHDFQSVCDLEDFVMDDICSDDRITGFSQGWYRPVIECSKECVLDGNNIELLAEAMIEGGHGGRLAKLLLNQKYPLLDTYIRVYVCKALLCDELVSYMN